MASPDVGMTLWRATAVVLRSRWSSAARWASCSAGPTAIDQAFMPWVLVLDEHAGSSSSPCSAIIWFRLDRNRRRSSRWCSASFQTIPMIVRDGVRSFDPGLDDIGFIYRFSLLNDALPARILLPQAMPFIDRGGALGHRHRLEDRARGRAVRPEQRRRIRDFEIFRPVRRAQEIIGYSVAFSLVMLAVEFLDPPAAR